MALPDACLPADWDARLHAFPDASVFHSAAWAQALAEAYGYLPRYRASAGSAAGGLLPVMEVRSALTGVRGVSLPFSDEVPALGVLPGTSGDLVEAVLAEGRDRGWKTVQFRGGEPFGADAVPSSRYLTHTLDLAAEPDALFTRLGGAFRQAVRKAEGAGVAVSLGYDTQAVRAFCRLNARTRRRHGLPPQPLLFFDSVRRYLLEQGMGFIVLAQHGQIPLAAAMFLHFGPQATFKYAASDRRFQSFRAANLVLWHGILECRRAGCRRLSLGRTQPRNAGLLRFKRATGAVESPLPYFTYSFREKVLIADPDRLNGLSNKLFRLLPLPLSRLAGALLYRHFA